MTERDGWGFPKSWRISLIISLSYYARCDWSIGLMHDYVKCWDSFFRILVMFEFLETIVIYADAIITVTTSEVLRWLTDSSSIILVPKGHDPLGKHQESWPPSWLDFQIIRYANYSFPLTRRPIIVRSTRRIRSAKYPLCRLKLSWLGILALNRILLRI